jgi:hypothetical protein
MEYPVGKYCTYSVLYLNVSYLFINSPDSDKWNHYR